MAEVQGNEVLMGGYNPQKRRREVLERLEDELKKIDVLDILRKVQDEHPQEDASIMYLKSKLEEINEQNDEIFKFENLDMHFTKHYRTMYGHCGKLREDLDCIDVSGRDDLRKLRKDAYIQIDTMVEKLASKAHEDGNLCEGCEVRE